MTSHLRTGNIIYHTSSPSFADVGITSPSPNTCQWMVPIVGTSRQPTIQNTTAPYPHGELCEQTDKYGNWRHVTIEMIPGDIFLEIFDFYRLDAIGRSRGRPWKWLRLAHVCRKWRHVMQTSPRRLDLQIYCKSGASIKRTLGAWPTLPLVVRFRGTLKSKSLPRNVVIALRHPDRVCEIDLYVTSSMIRSIAEMVQEPCLALKRIQVTSVDAAEPPVLGEFLGGFAPLLERIELDGIAVPFSTLRRLLLSTNNLVEVRLENIQKIGYFSSDALVTVLHSLTQLRTLHVRFRPPVSRAGPTRARPPPLERTILPSLINFRYYGASEYLEGFVARIEAPALIILSIGFFNQLIFEIPQFCQFISRLGGFKPVEAYVTLAEKSVLVFIRQKRGSVLYPVVCYLLIPCRQLDWQLSFATQMFSQLSGLSSLETFMFNNPYARSAGKEDADSAQWLELFQQLSHVSEVRVNLEEIVPDVVQALVSDDTATGVFPNLTSLSLSGYRKSKPVIEAAERFVAMRRLAGRSVTLLG